MSASAMRNTPDRKGERLIKFVMGKAFHSFGGLVLGFSDVLRDLGGEILKNLSKNRKISVWSALRVKMVSMCGPADYRGKALIFSLVNP